MKLLYLASSQKSSHNIDEGCLPTDILYQVMGFWLERRIHWRIN